VPALGGGWSRQKCHLAVQSALRVYAHEGCRFWIVANDDESTISPRASTRAAWLELIHGAADDGRGIRHRQNDEMARSPASARNRAPIVLPACGNSPRLTLPALFSQDTMPQERQYCCEHNGAALQRDSLPVLS